MKKVQPASSTSDISSQYSVAASHNQTQWEGSDSTSKPEEQTARHQTLQDQEEDDSSPEEDGTCSLEGDKSEDLTDVETIIIQDSHLTQDGQGCCLPRLSVGRSKEISEDLRKEVVKAYQNGLGYKNISKELGLCRSTVRHIICKWKKFSTVATLPRSGRPTKISAKARLTILKQMAKKQRETAKALQASFTLDNINGCETSSKTGLFPSPFSMMEDKNNSNICKEDPHNRANMRRVQPVGNTSLISSLHNQTQWRVSDSASEPEEHTEDDHDNLVADHQAVQVKEDEDSSTEKEDTGSVEGDKSEDLTNVETVMIQDSPLTRDAQGRCIPKLSVGRSKEISEDLRQKVVEAHKSGKGYKSISKELGLHRSTVRQIIYKWKKFSTVLTLPRSGRPTKISAKARRTIVKQMTTNPRVTSKDLQASLALDNICVHQSTIRKTLSKWCSWDFTKEEIAELQKD
ncbi:uncharacterized protein [Hyperolius riggenbachi]|uniref:uncharacterized protein n=1 Tax=Hyperolius riggenbachi TaxID=752182 RepID=UPI0035A34DC4